jgi:hypothetical protein
MLRSKYRIDIEDKGCSGETFLAAVEVLFKKMPQFAIFENVLNAPWQKMVGKCLTLASFIDWQVVKVQSLKILVSYFFL